MDADRFGLRDQCGRESQLRKSKSLHSRQTANEGKRSFSDLTRKQAGKAGLILLFDGEVGPLETSEPRRAQPNRYPDLEPNLTPAFPIPLGGTSGLAAKTTHADFAVGVRISIQWRNRPGFSPGSLTLDCDYVPHARDSFKERTVRTRAGKNCQAEFQRMSEAGAP